MTVHTICDRCGMEYDWPGIAILGQVYCCDGCARGVGCTCAQEGRVFTAGPGTTIIAPDDDVVIVE